MPRFDTSVAMRISRGLLRVVGLVFLLFAAALWSHAFAHAPGPELGDYAGLPINAADRQKAESWERI
jgi:hypothetical protein